MSPRSDEQHGRARQSYAEIDKRIDKFRALLRSATDPAEIERINRQIIQLYGERVRLHRNEES